MKISLQVNSKTVHVDVPPKKRLLDILREDLGLMGSKEGCGKGECGACTVLLDGKRVNSCLVPAFQLQGSRVVTIEGINEWPVYKSVKKSYIENGAVQCGFCMSGFVMSTVAFLQEKNTNLTEEEIKLGMGGNICRCTGYTKIINSVRDLSDHKEILSQIDLDWRTAFHERD